MSEELDKLPKEVREKLVEIVEKILEQGQLMVIGTKQCGKTNISMWLLRTIRALKEHEEGKIVTKTFDTCKNWKWKFDNIPCINHGEISYTPSDLQDLILDLDYPDTNDVRNAITDIILMDYLRLSRVKDQMEGEVSWKEVYFIEEMQNCFGSYSLNGSQGRFLLKVFSECANFGQVIIGLGQRLSDISTKVVERARFLLIGYTSGDNDKRKLRRIDRQLAEKVGNLKKYEFIFFDKETRGMDIIRVPLFDNKGNNPKVYKNSKKCYVKHTEF